MIFVLLLNAVVTVVGFIFSWVPSVDTLPTIGGFDIDSALASGMQTVNTMFITFWPLKIMFTGFITLMGYYAIKYTLKFFLGSRMPSH